MKDTDANMDYDTYVQCLKHLAENGHITDGKSGCENLEIEIQSGNIETLHILINAGISVNCEISLGSTPLHLAAETGKLEIVQLLISHGADLHLEDYVDASFLEAAIITGQYGIVEYVVKNHYNELKTRKPGQMNPLDFAACTNNVAIVKLLLQHDYDPNRRSLKEEGDSFVCGPLAFHYSFQTLDGTESQPSLVIKELIKAGLDIDQELIFSDKSLIAHGHKYEGRC